MRFMIYVIQLSESRISKCRTDQLVGATITSFVRKKKKKKNVRKNKQTGIGVVVSPDM